MLGARMLVVAASAWTRPPMSRLAVARAPARRLAPLCSAAAAVSSPASAAAPLPPTLDVMAWLSGRVGEALVEAFGAEYEGANPQLTPATKAEFGDYQCNAAMSLAKPLKSKPRDVAATLVDTLRIDEYFEAAEVAGPGFLNLRLKPAFLRDQLSLMLADSERCAVPAASPAQRVVVDYSSPNIAKEMHVGHLRSTIIGDSLANVLELRGHSVLRLNHVGDWGTQFGMLILHLADVAPAALAGETELDISDLVGFYKEAKARFDADEAFKESARAEVVRLQRGEPDSLRAWRMLCGQSEKAFTQVYQLLSVDGRLQTRGESFYNGRLAGTVDALRASGLLVESDGAQCIFLDGYKTRDGQPQPMIVQKSDGGFMYSTTDLAALAQRSADEACDRILYVTDSGQATHFAQVFEIGYKAGLVPPATTLEHVPFGLVLGEDGKKFKTRSGETVKLMDLLDEALKRAEDDVACRLESEERDEPGGFVRDVSRAVGIGAVKYADLSMNRNSNYRFSYEKMLSLSGNTAPYMMYAYARIRGIERRAATKLGVAAVDQLPPLAGGISLAQPAELALARHLLKLGDTIKLVEAELLPSKLCEYIFELSGKFNQFYESCPVVAAETAELQRSRLAMCEVTASVLRLSLGLLGIQPLERM